MLQAAFRGHLARVKLLSSQARASESPGPPSSPSQDPLPPHVPSPAVQAEDDPGQEEAITTIQSVLRAHLARVRHSDSSPRTAVAASRRRSPTLASPRQLPAAPCPASPGQEDSDTSGGEIVEGPAAEDEAPGPWGPGKPAALPPCSGPPSPSGPRPQPQPTEPPPADDSSSDDSDEIVVAPVLPTRKATAPP